MPPTPPTTGKDRGAHPLEALVRKWHTSDPRRVIGHGHPIGDFLEAYDWDLLEEREGFLRVACHLPAQVRNPRGDLFGGFTPVYADFIAVFTGRAAHRGEPPTTWLNTASLSLDYFRPIKDHFVCEGEVIHRTGRTRHIQIRFLAGVGAELLALAKATIVEAPRAEPET
ncbi:MAG TPA: PaaI family thioesterase [Candidatus Binatia bacterium]|jgi:acyl-coenzyme A thioesterase PaaI-like protein